jgi:hypothetical protein
VQLHHVHHVSPELLARFDRLLGLLERRDSTMSTQLHELQAAVGRLEQNVSEQTTVMASAVLLIQGLADQVREAAAGQDLDQVRQRLNNLTATLDAEGDALAAAVAAHTPGAEQPDPEPPAGEPPPPQDVETEPDPVAPAEPVVVPVPVPGTEGTLLDPGLGTSRPAGEIFPDASVNPPGVEISPAQPASESPLPETFQGSLTGRRSRGD